MTIDRVLAEMAAQAMLIASELLGVPPIAPPAIQSVDSYIMDQACEVKPCRTYYGLYEPGKPYIVINASEMTLRTEFGKSVLIHETVHYLQEHYRSRKWPELDCSEKKAAEDEAYRVQQQYLDQYETHEDVLSAWRFDSATWCMGDY